MESSTPIISVDDVSFSYGSDAAPRALDHVSLDIATGDFLGIIGSSGAGKSTLTSVLSGAIPHHFGGAFYGAAHVAGQDTCTITLTDVARSVGSVLQDIDAQMVASVVEDELLFGLENFGVNHSEIPARIERTLDARGDLAVVHAEILQAEEQLVFHHGGDHLRIDVLQHATDRARDVRERDGAGILPRYVGRAIERASKVVRNRAGEHGGERRLAGARGADDAQEVAGGDIQAHMVERARRGVAAVGKRDVVDGDDRGG